jgi:hypothetical protein
VVAGRSAIGATQAKTGLEWGTGRVPTGRVGGETAIIQRTVFEGQATTFRAGNGEKKVK